MDGKAPRQVKVLINAVSAKLGGAATYIQNLARSLGEISNSADEFVFLVPTNRVAEMQSASSRIRTVACDASEKSYARRWWWDQVGLRKIVERERPDVLFSSANFGMLRSPCPQVLLVRIPIYFSTEYIQHVLAEKSFVFRAETVARRWLVCRSVAAADRLMTPTVAMLDDLRRFAEVDDSRAVVNAYGVPRARLNGGASTHQKHSGRLRLLWVSHYADHKNLSTLLDAVEMLRHEGEVSFELVLTLDPGLTKGQHTPLSDGDRRRLENLTHPDGARAEEVTVNLVGVQSYDATWNLYRNADIFVFPSLCESFGHPLVEAMANSLPIVASDIPVHREICGDAAMYFPPLDASTLSGVLRRLLQNERERVLLAKASHEQAQRFVWEDHVARLLSILRETAANNAKRAAA